MVTASAVMIPTGISVGVSSVRAKVSAMTRYIPPMQRCRQEQPVIRPKEKSDGVRDDHPNEPNHSLRHHCASDQGREQ